MPTLSSAMATAAAASFNEPFVMVYLDVAGDPLFAWSGQADRSFTIAGDPLLSTARTFLGLAALGEVSGVVHAADGTIAAVTLRLGFADFTDPATYDFINYVDQWSQRAAVLWFGYRNSAAGTIVADPVRIATMRMVHVAATDGPSPGLILKLAGRAAADGLRASGWKFSDAHLQAFWPGDKALEFVPQLVGKELRFGVADAVVRTGGGGDGIPRSVGGGFSQRSV